jgi:lipopolysaccharide/colanic/teichoic acid biosynthesis glycosyltransferase
MHASAERISTIKLQGASAAIPENSVAAPRMKFTVPEFGGAVGAVPGQQNFSDIPLTDVVQVDDLSAGEVKVVRKTRDSMMKNAVQTEFAGAATARLERSHVVERLTSTAQPAIRAASGNYGRTAIAAKRAMDTILGLLLILGLSALFVVLALLVKITSPGPIFYVQERVGQHGRLFRMYKFRSMKVNADAELAELLHAQGTANKPLFKVDKDPRLTSIGGFLRRYSLDELPQLINVLVGNMSLVGPRPQRPGEVALYDERARRRLLVPPGMTGLWQVSGRSNLSWKESLHLDIHYVDNWSLVADWVILFRTFRAVFACTGAV